MDTAPSPAAPQPSGWGCFTPSTFAEQTVLVTGAAGGMGRQLVRAFGACGAHVAAGDLYDSADTGTCDDEVLRVHLDVADDTSVTDAFAAVDQQLGPVDHVVHSAAAIASTGFLDADAAHWRRLLDINLVGSFLVAQHALRRMLPRGHGSLVLVASDAGHRGGGGLIADAPYAATKAGVLSLVKSLTREFAQQGVRVTALSPGPSDTPMHAGISAQLKQRIADGLPAGRMGRPDDIAGAALFLCSPAAEFVHGTCLDVDGGSTLR
jgi:3-oxoacyl-[acyl-carrier protein] reductase